MTIVADAKPFELLADSEAQVQLHVEVLGVSFLREPAPSNHGTVRASDPTTCPSSPVFGTERGTCRRSARDARGR